MMRDKQQRPTLALARHSSFWNRERSSQRTTEVCLNHLFLFDTLRWISTLVFFWRSASWKPLYLWEWRQRIAAKMVISLDIWRKRARHSVTAPEPIFTQISARQTSCPKLFLKNVYNVRVHRHMGTTCNILEVIAVFVFGGFSSEFPMWMNEYLLLNLP